VAEFPVCGDAFAFDQIAGYNFMSVLTHDQGRSVVGPRDNVCGFNSETSAAARGLDPPINWSTSNISSGPQTFPWNITWDHTFPVPRNFATGSPSRGSSSRSASRCRATISKISRSVS
jgi:hypothetical protein